MARMVWSERNKKQLERLGKTHNYRQIAVIMKLKESSVLNALSQFNFSYVRLRKTKRPMQAKTSLREMIESHKGNLLCRAWV